jgi:hypothetical protein
MKSQNKKKWTWASILATGVATDLLKHAPKGGGVPVCVNHVSKSVIFKSRRQLRKEIDAHRDGEFFQEARAIETRCISATDRRAVYEVKGGLVRYGVINFKGTLIIEASVFRVRLTFQRCPRPSGEREIRRAYEQKEISQPTKPLFPVIITDFNYENIH